MPNWTPSQQSVIDNRDHNLIVSAAAGSGKTAVLVERIIKKIVEEHVSVDSLLVVTFTKAAAKEMSEKIRKAIANKLKENPDDEFLLMQNTLISNADISTIDSFCGNLVKNHFNEIGIDPSFRICDSGEEKLLINDVMTELLEENYARKDETFIQLMEYYTKANNESNITDLIIKLYEKSSVCPWPNEWLDEIKKPYLVQNEKELMEQNWIKKLAGISRNKIMAAFKNLYEIEEMYGDIVSPSLQKKLAKDLPILEDAMLQFTLKDICMALKEFEKVGISSCTKMSDEEFSFVKKELNIISENIKSIQNIKLDGEDSVLHESQQISKYALEIIRLTEEFKCKLEQEKEKRCLVNFNDIERFALNVLIDPVGKKLTNTALELQEYYSEVMVDEYQDVNKLQETILKTIASPIKKNYFCVGDVKQSIYCFRLADPQIFKDQYAEYKTNVDDNTAISLNANFRSREEVLDITNDIFTKLMSEKIGGVEYDDEAALHFGAKEIYQIPNDNQPEILLVDKDIQDEARKNGDDFKEKGELEATIVAQRIQRLISEGFKVTNKETGELEDVKYSDIVILLRSTKSTGNVYEKVLTEKNIPCHFENEKGYFESIEVRMMLSFLKVLDNPNQDIDLAAVLHGPIYRIDNTTLAKVRNVNSEQNLYYAIKEYLEENSDEKLSNAMSSINELRDLVSDTPIHTLLEIIYDKTGYLDLVSALPKGEYRRINLIQLVDKAIEFEKTSYSGLFHFVRYIESMKEYDLDMGTPSMLGENDNVVRIMTMHKSKGLEFPVVFVSGLGGKFSKMDEKNQNLVHSTYGLGIKGIKLDEKDNKVEFDSMYRTFIKEMISNDFYSEEARLLYVALTRAREKLIMTACVDKVEERVSNNGKNSINYIDIQGATCFMDWIEMSLKTYSNKYSYVWNIVEPEEVIVEDVIAAISLAEKRNALTNRYENVDENIVDRVKERIEFEYPYIRDERIRNKYSVSDIKHKKMHFEDEEAEQKFEFQHEKESVVPSFISHEKYQEANDGALYGTAMHRVMECFDFAVENMSADLENQLQNMSKLGLVTDDALERISLKKLKTFLDSDIAKRMQNAARTEHLFVEKPFVIGEHPSIMYEDASSELDDIIVQGIIDVFFVEEDGIVLLDYKTDKVNRPEDLIGRYQAQIDIYANAIEKAMGKKVKEKLLYSFKFDTIVEVE